MDRRRWIAMFGMGGLSAALGGCAAHAGTVRLDARTSVMLGRGALGWGIWRDGRLVSGCGLDQRLSSLSITKAFAGLCAARAIGDGWLTAGTTLDRFFPEWSGSPKGRVTVRMLTNMSAGFPSGVPQLYRGRVADKGAAAAVLPLVDPHAAIFRYGPASWELLGEVLRRGLSGRCETLESWCRSVMADVGIGSPGWRTDGRGRPYLSTGAEWSVAELARLGETIARLVRGGNVGSIRAPAFQELSEARVANPMFSAGIWWNRNARTSGAYGIEPEREIDDPRPPQFWQRACLSPAADPGWLALIGSGGKRVFVLPERRIVMVRLARGGGWSDSAFLRSLSA